MVPDPREAHLDRLTTWLVVWTAIVVVGLLLEYLEDIPKAIAAIKGLKKLDWTPYQGANGLKYRWSVNHGDIAKVVAVIGIILVTLGVAGEMYIEAVSGIVEHALRSDADLTIASLQNQTADTNERAAEANERAAKAEKAAEQEKLARLEYEELYGPRRLSEKQRGELVKDWSKHAGRTVKLGAASDPESNAFADDLFDILTKAGLKVIQTPIPQTESGMGVLLTGSWDDFTMLDDVSNSLGCAEIFSWTMELCGKPACAKSPFSGEHNKCDFRIDVFFTPIGSLSAMKPRCRQPWSPPGVTCPP